MRNADNARNIPSLDGLRAVSILMVIVAHSNQGFSRWLKIPVRSYLFFAHTGVSVFFIISGFLITNLLLKELNATGSIGLKRFYLRRAFRIFPPFYLYLGVVFALVLAGFFHTPLHSFVFAAIYLENYNFASGAGFVGLQHIWSLSVEEQFYLLWPATLLVSGKRRSIFIAAFLILISPVSRVVTYYVLAPEHRAMVDRMLHSTIDTIMFGCLLALLWKNDRFNRWMRPLLHSWLGPGMMAGSLLFLFVVDPVLDYRFHGQYNLLVGMTLQSISICLALLYVVRRPESAAGRFLNWAPLRHIGVISYSLYLWQNIIIGEAGRYFPLDLIAVFTCAELSYWFVERPSLRIRDRLQRRRRVYESLSSEAR